MSLALIIYFISVSANLHKLAWGLVILTGLMHALGVLVFFASGDESGSTREQMQNFAKRIFGLWWVTALAFLFSVFAPSKELAYQMLAAYGVQQVAENPQVQTIAGNSLKLLEQTISKYLDDEETAKAEEEAAKAEEEAKKSK